VGPRAGLGILETFSCPCQDLNFRLSSPWLVITLTVLSWLIIVLRHVTKKFLRILLCARFKGGKIYTYIGEVCVSVNPYRTMNIYGPEQVAQYKGEFITRYDTPCYSVTWR
jgi:hypothetical protein